VHHSNAIHHQSCCSQGNYIYGFHAVKTLLRTNNHGGSAIVDKVYLLVGRQDKRSKEIIDLIEQSDIQCERATKDQLDRLANFAKHQGFVALWHSADGDTSLPLRARNSINNVKDDDLEDLHALVYRVAARAFFLVLDGIQDPHNLGACLRTANATGVHAVIVPKDNAVGLTAAVRKVACGAAETTPVFQVTNLARTLRFLREQNIWIYGLTPRAEKNIHEIILQRPLALVLGAEANGLRRLTREQCDCLISIPMCGTVESLNVSVATGICLFEVVRNLAVSQ